MTIRTYDTVEEQRDGLEIVARNIEIFWRHFAEEARGGIDLSIAVEGDAGTLRLIASKLGA
jgi:hypothetical protein